MVCSPTPCRSPTRHPSGRLAPAKLYASGNRHGCRAAARSTSRRRAPGTSASAARSTPALRRQRRHYISRIQRERGNRSCWVMSVHSRSTTTLRSTAAVRGAGLRDNDAAMRWCLHLLGWRIANNATARSPTAWGGAQPDRGVSGKSAALVPGDAPISREEMKLLFGDPVCRLAGAEGRQHQDDIATACADVAVGHPICATSG
jgi:hypothetical protein